MTPLSSSPPVQWTVADLDGFADNGNRYEIIAGDLHVTRAPHWDHQDIAGGIYADLRSWSRRSGLGQPAFAPGVIFTAADAVIPDVVWASHDKLHTLLDEAGHLTGAPELVVEVLSKTEQDRRRDREFKLKLYSIQGVLEYWIVDPSTAQVEVYRRDRGLLQKAMTLYRNDTLTTPTLPEFEASLEGWFPPPSQGTAT